MARSDQTAFVVEILEGPSAGVSVNLLGRELPYRSAEGGSISYGRTQRSQLTWYPGSRVASQQVIGPILEPTTINGIWKERYLSEDQPITLTEAFEELCSSGVQVRVSWQTITRLGIIKSFRWQPGAATGGLTDISWECTFEWNAEPGRSAIRVNGATSPLREQVALAANRILTFRALVELFVSRVDNFVGLPNQPFAPSAASLARIDEENQVLLNALASTAVAAGEQANFSAELALGALSAAEGAQDNAAETVEVILGYSPAITASSDRLDVILNQAIDRYDVLDGSTTTLREMFSLRRELEPLVDPETFTVVAAQPGVDLRVYARQFYGNSDDWVRIARFNGIEGSTTPDGLGELIIPLTLPDALDERGVC